MLPCEILKDSFSKGFWMALFLSASHSLCTNSWIRGDPESIHPSTHSSIHGGVNPLEAWLTVRYDSIAHYFHRFFFVKINIESTTIHQGCCVYVYSLWNIVLPSTVDQQSKNFNKDFFFKWSLNEWRIVDGSFIFWFLFIFYWELYRIITLNNLSFA